MTNVDDLRGKIDRLLEQTEGDTKLKEKECTRTQEESVLMTEREIRFALSFFTAEQRQKLLAHLIALRVYRETHRSSQEMKQAPGFAE